MKEIPNGYTEIECGTIGDYRICYKDTGDTIDFDLEVDQLGCEDIGRNFGLRYCIVKDGGLGNPSNIDTYLKEISGHIKKVLVELLSSLTVVEHKL